jgi:hypothetical protein
LTASARRGSNVLETQIESCFPFRFFPTRFTGWVSILSL